MEEIKTELRQDNLAVKANAVAKLTYVSTLPKGYVLFNGMGLVDVTYLACLCDFYTIGNVY